MGMSEFYGATDEGEAIATMHRALELGVTLLDTADAYGPHTNEVLVGRAIADRRDQVVLATKFGVVRGEDPAERWLPNLVATTTPSRRPRIARPTSSSLVNGP